MSADRTEEVDDVQPEAATRASTAGKTTLADRIPKNSRTGTIVAGLGAVVLIASTFLSWSYDPDPLDDLSITGYPAPIQILAIILGVVALLFLALYGPLRSRFSWFDSVRGLGALSIAAVIFMVLVLVSITVESGGLVNIDPGGWIALVGTILLAVGAAMLPAFETSDALRVKWPRAAEILLIVAMLAGMLFFVAYVLGLEDAGSFVVVGAFAAAIGYGFARGNFFSWLTIAAARNRTVLMLATIVVVFLFPLTQSGSDANMSIAVQVIIFAVTALGLNIVVGLAGLLDLGYIAFLGTGSYVGATMSTSLSATIGWHPPFLVVMLIGAIVAACLGLIIGSPTLRVSGDYLAIVTLAFGEIFRIVVNNLDGVSGPDLTHGPNGVTGIPELNLFGLDFGTTWSIGPFTLTRWANYYFLLLVLGALIITIFVRMNNSRIGRGWVAIREDERAAEAMGVNVFGLKLLAFAGGAFLAGMAGTVKAHIDVSVTPDDYTFIESSFLLAAVVLGGMGTVLGVILGATILKLLPEKLRAISDYRLLIFGVLLVLMMRFRPEGLVPSRRRQLEFHDEDEALASYVEEEHIVEKGATT